MLRHCLVILAIGTAALAAPVMAADCKQEVFDAFEKQRKSKAYRMAAEMMQAANSSVAPEQVKLTVDYMPPDRMHQVINSPAMPAPMETVLVGTRAWATNGGGFEELRPEFAQSIVSHVHQTLIEPPKDVSNYECLGKQSYEGKEYLAYKSVDPNVKPGDKAAVERRIYVDAATGLPAHNVVAAIDGKAAPIFKGTYSYPTDINIVAIEGAPVATSK